MPQPHTVGLTLGKYAPFHRGHQLVFDTALAEVEQLHAIIYDSPEVTTVPLPVRARWLRHLYPQVRVVEAWDGPSEVGDTPAIRDMHERYVIERLGIRGITHFYSSEFYGEHMSRALGALNRQVDAARTQWAVSGTQVRADPYAWRHALAALVYRDLVVTVAFVGVPESGTAALAEHTAAAHRTVWIAVGTQADWNALLEYAFGQANRYLFVDAGAHWNAEYAPYDLVFLCGLENSGDNAAQVVHKQLVAELLIRKVPFITLRGTLAERAATVARVLARFSKYTSVADALL